MVLKLFVDFDGTITKDDVGNLFFRKYAGRERYNQLLLEYKAERMSAKECFRRGIDAIGRLERDEVLEFARGQEIDLTFKECVEYCRENSIKLHIVSDGLDFYIDEILAANGINGVPVFSNRLEFVPVVGSGLHDLRINFPHADAECDRCACCKRNVMLTHAGDEDIIVYVGEGYSDRCPAQYADIVFAKDALQTFCQEQNISYYPYTSFRDVTERLSLVRESKKLRKRLAAETKRRELFMREP